jgi:nitrate reductase beta subunit
VQKIFIEVVYHANAVQIGFCDPEKARSAYDKISAALREFRSFQNDRTETIEVDTENGLSTFKLENMSAVLYNGPYDDGPEIEAALQREKMLREKRVSYGLPPTIRDL